MKTVFIALLLISTSATNVVDDWKKDRPISGISGLRVSSGINVYLSQGNTEKLTLDVKGIDEDMVISEVKNGVLKLYVEKNGLLNWSLRSRSVNAYLTIKQLASIQASGGADIVGQTTLSLNDVAIDASGGADIKLTLNARKVSSEASGGADVVLKGTANTLNASASGGADLDARNLRVDVCRANSSGGSDVYVNASQELTMHASGGSDIYYSGAAKTVSKSKSGGGDISRRD